MATVEKVSTIRVAGGDLIKFKAPSEETGTVMTASIFLPKAAQTGSVPVLYYLSGLTCTDDNVCQKGGAFMALAEKGIAMICPDTSPRGAGVEGTRED
jgi:S-formylglutathione hydrolase